jgi:hypothetical protein
LWIYRSLILAGKSEVSMNILHKQDVCLGPSLMFH